MAPLAAPGGVSELDAPAVTSHDQEHGYQSRIAQEWKDQLEANKNTTGSHDETDIDNRALYGEQAVHNFPDVHADWGDATVMAARSNAAKLLREKMAENGSAPSFHDTGWNTEYRAGLELAMATVRDSKQTMGNIRAVRALTKDIEDGVEVGHLKGKTAKEASVEWEQERFERLEAEARKRRAAAEVAAKSAARENKSQQDVAGLPALPDFLKPATQEDSTAALAAASALGAKHDEWIQTLGGDRVGGTAETASEKDEDATLSESTTPSKHSEDPRDESNVDESNVDPDDDPDDSFFANFTSLSPLRKAAASKTASENFWGKEMWGADGENFEERNLDDALATAEAEMAALCALEISKARKLSLGEE